MVSRAQLGGPLEYPTVHLLRNSHIYHLSKFQLDPTVQTPGTFRLVHHFSDLFSARERVQPKFIFFTNGISDILFEGSFVWSIVFCFQTHHANFKVFSNMIFTIARCQTSPTTLLHGFRPAPDGSSLHRAEPSLIGSSARQAEQELGKPNKSLAS